MEWLYFGFRYSSNGCGALDKHMSGTVLVLLAKKLIAHIWLSKTNNNYQKQLLIILIKII